MSSLYQYFCCIPDVSHFIVRLLFIGSASEMQARVGVYMTNRQYISPKYCSYESVKTIISGELLLTLFLEK